MLPYSDATGLNQLRIPVCSIRGSDDGPNITLIAGVHGDEYEGALTLHHLAQELSPHVVHGCLLIVPALNGRGMVSAQRGLPMTGDDLDLCFPGQLDGNLGQRVAAAVMEHLVRPAELVLDLRSGGRRLQFAPSIAVRFMSVSNQKG